MSTTLIIRDEAREDLAQAAEYLEEHRGPVAVEKFKADLRELAEEVRLDPSRYPAWGKWAIRRSRPSRHKHFRLYYRIIEGGVVEVIAAVHHARRPNFWTDRLA